MSTDTEILLKGSDDFGYSYRATFAHSAVHRDKIMQAQDYATAVTVRDYLIDTPSGITPHLMFTVKSNKQARVQFFEGVTVSANGTELISARLRRSSEQAISTKIYHTPTITDLGTELPGDFIPGSAIAGGTGGQASIHDGAEWMLKRSTQYIIRVTNDVSGIISLKAEWYE